MSIVGQIAGGVVRESIRAATPPRQAPPPRHPGTVAALDGKVTLGTPPRTAAKPIDGMMLWCYIRRYLAHYVAFRTEEELNRATAWAFHACARRRGELGMGPLIWNATPRLLVKSRKRGAGKSTLLDLLVYLTGSRRGKTPRITPARLAQIIGQAHEAVFVDEGRLVFGAGQRHEDLQACLLVGYTPNGSYEVSKTSLSVFGPVAIATKESLITEASKAVDGDESSLGDLLDRCLTITLTAPDFPMPEVGKRAKAEGELLARALVAWTDTFRDALEEAAEDVASEDYEAAQERARRGERQTETPRALQIGRPLRAIGRVIDQQVITEARRKNAGNPSPGYKDPEPRSEADILACLGAQSEDIMGELEALSGNWGDGQFTGDDDDEEPQDGLAEFAPPPARAASRPAPTVTYAAGYVRERDGHEPIPCQFATTWATVAQAQQACEDDSRGPLHWNEDPEAGTWGAVVFESGGTKVTYAVYESGE